MEWRGAHHHHLPHRTTRVQGTANHGPSPPAHTITQSQEEKSASAWRGSLTCQCCSGEPQGEPHPPTHPPAPSSTWSRADTANCAPACLPPPALQLILLEGSNCYWEPGPNRSVHLGSSTKVVAFEWGIPGERDAEQQGTSPLVH